MKTALKTCLLLAVAGAALTLAGCDDSNDVVDVTPRKVNPDAPKIDPDAGPGGGFTPMEEDTNRTNAGG